MKTEHLSDEDCRVQLEDLYSGNAVAIPTSIEHAEYMIRVARFYIGQQYDQTMKALKA